MKKKILSILLITFIILQFQIVHADEVVTYKSATEYNYPPFSVTSRAEGTGLGLSISYGIIKEHNGELSFETEEGKFTKFHIDLPII